MEDSKENIKTAQPVVEDKTIKALYGQDKVWDYYTYHESKDDPKAVGPTEDYGIGQITQPLLTDVNSYNKTNYKLEDMFDPEISKQVWTTYGNLQGKRFFKENGRNPNEEEWMRIYHGGYGGLRNNKPEMLGYLNTYYGKSKPAKQKILDKRKKEEDARKKEEDAKKVKTAAPSTLAPKPEKDWLDNTMDFMNEYNPFL